MSMSFVRRHFAWMICAWLACQVASVAAAPLAFCCKSVPATDPDDKCCPGMLPGQICPMHHKKEGERTCKMRNACTRSDAALISLAGGLGTIPRPTPTVNVFDSGTFVTPIAPSAILRAHVPESPPPRA
jgi:hypothetical protein